MTLTSVIIPNYNGLSVLMPCVESIIRHVHTPYEVIVVDNGSQDGSVEYCLNQRLRVISLPDNRGFPAACNLGMLAAMGDELLLLNNDTLMTRGGLDNMLRCLYSSEDIGIVGPMSNYASGRQQIQEPFSSVDEMAERWNVPDSGKWQEVQRIVGLCFLFRRGLMERIGLLDERFSPGHYEDDDYCYRARREGFRLMIAGDSFVFHHGSASFEREGRELTQRLVELNRQKFIDKWGVDPAGMM